jgi:hypothetical protein
MPAREDTMTAIITFAVGQAVIYRTDEPAIVLDDDGRNSKVRIRLADGRVMFAWRKRLQAA